MTKDLITFLLANGNEYTILILNIVHVKKTATAKSITWLSKIEIAGKVENTLNTGTLTDTEYIRVVALLSGR